MESVGTFNQELSGKLVVLLRADMFLKPKRLYIYHLLMLLVPETSCFGLKRWLLRWCGATLGENVRICSSVKIYGVGKLTVGDDVWIGSGTWLNVSAKVILGSHIDVAPQVYIGTGTHPIDVKGLHSAGNGQNFDITIEDGVWLGARSMVMPNVTIGKKAILGAGAVAINNIACNTIAVGMPAKSIKYIDGKSLGEGIAI